MTVCTQNSVSCDPASCKCKEGYKEPTCCECEDNYVKDNNGVCKCKFAMLVGILNIHLSTTCQSYLIVAVNNTYS